VKVLSEDSAEIDDIDVIREGDNLFLVNEETEKIYKKDDQ